MRLRPALQRGIIGGSPLMPGATLALDFATQRYRYGAGRRATTRQLTAIPGFTFTRPGTNLQVYSGDGTQWTASAVTRTESGVAYLPGGKRVLITDPGAAGAFNRIVSPGNITVTSGAAYTITLWYELGTSNSLRLLFDNGGTTGITRVGGTWAAAGTSLGTMSIVSDVVVSGSVRQAVIAWTPNAGATGAFGFGPNATGSDETVVFHGLQFEPGSVANAYQPTTSAALTNAPITYAETLAGVLVPSPANVLRVTDKGALIEEAGTNLGLWSEDLSNAAYLNRSNFTISTGQAGAPNGTSTFTKLIPTTTSNSKEIYQQPTTSAQTYTQSVYVKAAGYNFIRGRIYGGAGFVGDVIFNLATGTVQTTSSGSGTITALADGVYRLSVTGTATGTGGSFGWSVTTSSAGTVSYAGDGVSGALLWGFDIKASSILTSYIPTTTAAVTRAADVATITGLGSILAAPFTATIKVTTNASNAADQYLFNIDQTPTSSNDRISVLRDTAATISIYSISTAGGVKNIQNATSKSGARDLKVAFRGRSGATQSAIDGVLGSSDATAVPSNLAQVILGASRTQSVPLNGYIRQFQIAPDVGDAQLQALTT